MCVIAEALVLSWHKVCGSRISLKPFWFAGLGQYMCVFVYILQINFSSLSDISECAKHVCC